MLLNDNLELGLLIQLEKDTLLLIGILPSIIRQFLIFLQLQARIGQFTRNGVIPHLQLSHLIKKAEQQQRVIV